MNVAIRRRAMTREAFLAWAEHQEGHYEFDGFGPVAMTGGTNAHGIISGNIYFGLRRRLHGGPCQPMTAESGGVATVGDKVRYPDAAVTCSPVALPDKLIRDPVAVFEVVSPGSERTDHHEKPPEYGAVPSIAAYAIVEQARREVRLLRRGPDGGWLEATLRGGAVLDLPELGVSLPLDDIYEGVFPPS